MEDNSIRNNAKNGVIIVSSAAGNTIGGNQIFANEADGVRVQSDTGNSVLSNKIFGNGGLGIDLDPDGVTSNDTDDPDTGANNLQNFPVISSATKNSITGDTTITGTLNSNPSQSFTVQCFVADDDPSGHGEGLIFLTEDTTVTTNADGDASFSCVTPLRVAVGQTVSATATNQASGDTSEFSERVGVSPGP